MERHWPCCVLLCFSPSRAFFQCWYPAYDLLPRWELIEDDRNHKLDQVHDDQQRHDTGPDMSLPGAVGF